MWEYTSAYIHVYIHLLKSCAPSIGKRWYNISLELFRPSIQLLWISSTQSNVIWRWRYESRIERTVCKEISSCNNGWNICPSLCLVSKKWYRIKQSFREGMSGYLEPTKELLSADNEISYVCMYVHNYMYEPFLFPDWEVQCGAQACVTSWSDENISCTSVFYTNGIRSYQFIFVYLRKITKLI